MSNEKRLIVVILSIVGGLIFGIIIFNVLSPKQRNLRKLESAMDISNPATRKFSLKLASQYPGKFNINQVCKIYDYVFENWRYVNDPRGLDTFSKASLTIENNLAGDCDDFAVLIATAIESIGGKTRINVVYDEKTGAGHAFAEVYFKENPDFLREKIDYHFQNFFQVLFEISRVEEIHFIPDKIRGGVWLNLDWNSKYPGGKYFPYSEKTIYYPLQGYYRSEK